jgi:chemotaxis protein methyltransferase CheR
MYSNAYSLSDTLFKLLRDLIREQTGLSFRDEDIEIFIAKLSSRLIELGLTSFLDYYYLLKYDTSLQTEWGALMDVLTTGESYFWREPAQITAFVNEIVPKYVEAAPAMPLRIWSAACSTGEEPISLALALQEAGWFERLSIQIMASDISQKAIYKAKAGVYHERAFRNMPQALQTKYFTQEAKGWRVVPQIHNRISWQVANLLDETAHVWQQQTSAIFCRNVFIYFSAAAIQTTVQRFYRQLSTPGYLFVGVTEPLIRYTHNFHLQEIGNSFVYIKSA